jgi:hypothetical protein
MPDDVVSLGAAADAQMSAVVADVQPDAPTLPSLTGDWLTRTSVAVNQDGGATPILWLVSTTGERVD